MDISIFLAKAFGLYFLFLGAAIIIRRSWYQEVFTGMFECKHCLFMLIWLTLVLGILLVIVHPAFTPDWRSVITVLVWLTLLKGLLHLFFPKQLIGYKRKLLAKPAVYYVSGIICLVLGAFLAYKGFFCF